MMKYKQHNSFTVAWADAMTAEVKDRKRREELQEKLSRAKEAKTNPNVGANKTELGMMDGKPTLVTDTGWYTT